MPLCKVTDTPFHIQGDELLSMCLRMMITFVCAKLNNLNFHTTLEVVSRYRDPQLQVCQNESYIRLFETNLLIK